MTTTITPGSDSLAVVVVKRNGAAIAVTAPISATLKTGDGSAVLVPAKTLVGTEAGANWSAGVVAVPFTGADTAGLTPGNALLVVSGPFGSKAFAVSIEAVGQVVRSALFVRDVAVDRLREDRLMMAASGVMPDVQVSDDYLWDKLRAAESEVAHTLRVPLAPMRFFPIQPTDAELAALNGMAWDIDPGYDYEPEMFERDKWGYIVTRHRPIISVEYMRFAYPTQDKGFFNVPVDWLRIDSRPGHVRIVPSSSALLMGTAGFAMTTLINRRTVPAMVQVAYTAGLVNAAGDYPELMDVIQKKAVLKIMGDAYLPQSGSISADGLSQSMSVDMSKYSDSIDEIINGPKGSNGGLMNKIHGIRSMVF